MLQDLDVLFVDFSSEVTWGSSRFSGLLDTPDELAGGGLVISTDYQLLAKSSDIEGIIDGEILTVDGVSFEVRQVRKIDDGALSRVLLSKI